MNLNFPAYSLFSPAGNQYVCLYSVINNETMKLITSKQINITPAYLTKIKEEYSDDDYTLMHFHSSGLHVYIPYHIYL